jgi:hypothetical protein
MNGLRIPRIVCGFLLAIGVLDCVRRYPLLPARMASRFGPHGEVTDFQSKEQLFMTMVVVVGVSFVAGFVVVPLWLSWESTTPFRPVGPIEVIAEFLANRNARFAPGVRRCVSDFETAIRAIDNRGKDLRERRGVCASAKDDEACEGPSLRSGEYVRG